MSDAYPTRRWRQRFWWWITHPAGIPERVKRVDPSLFPEDEFPVRCLRCGYELRGLSESRCPECADEFERGRLLVDEYVHGRLPRADRCRIIAGRLSFVGLVFMLLAMIPFLLMYFGSEGAISLSQTQLGLFIDRLPRLLFLPIALLALGKLMTWCAGLVFARSLPPRAKREPVRTEWRAANRAIEVDRLPSASEERAAE